MAFNTGNPVPSTDARDLYDNATNLDKATNGTDPTWTDRLGVTRKSWAGMEQEFLQFLADSGFEMPPLAYVDGAALQILRPTQVIQRDNQLYRAMLPATFPVALSGTWASDQLKLTPMSDHSLRQELAALPGAGLVGFDAGEDYPINTVGAELKTQGAEIVSLRPGIPGAVGNGVADDTAAIQAAVTASGGVLTFEQGKTYKITGKILINHPLIIDLNGAVIQAEFTTQVPAFDVQSNYVRICRGSIFVNGTTMGGYGGSLNCIYAGNQATGAGWHNLRFHDLTVTTNRNDAGAHIGIIGECHNVVIENITVPDNANCRNIIGIEWGGTPELGTGHPHNIIVRNIECGRLTYPSSGSGGFGYVVWASGTFNVSVENISAVEAYGLMMAIAGDRSREFAPARYKNRVGTGLTLNGASISECFGYGVRAVGKGPASAVLSDVSIKVTGLKVTASPTAAGNVFGMQTEYSRGVHLSDFSFDGCAAGFATGVGAVKPVVEDGEIINSKLYGLQFGNGGGACIEPVLRCVKFKGNNANGGAGVGTPAVSLTNTRKPVIEGCTFGEPGVAETQKYSIACTVDTVRPVLNDNHTYALAASGAAYVLDTSANTTLVATGQNNTADAGLTLFSGAPIFTINRAGKREFLLPSNAVPTTGAWDVGDTGYYPSPAGGSYRGVTCVTAGTPGTWKAFGAIIA